MASAVSVVQLSLQGWKARNSDVSGGGGGGGGSEEDGQGVFFLIISGHLPSQPLFSFDSECNV